MSSTADNEESKSNGIEVANNTTTQACIPTGDGKCIPIQVTDCCEGSPVPLPCDTPATPAIQKTRKLLAEVLGTCLLVFIVVGSGIMATDLTDDVGVQLLINAFATTAGLYGLITIFGPVSGAHFNPVVSLVDTLFQDMAPLDLVYYTLCQIAGAILGCVVANVIYEVPTAISTKERYGYHLWISEIIASATLILAIHGCIRTGSEDRVPSVVSLWVGGGYFFTSSSIFANPAVTIGRIFTNTFAGIHPISAAVYIPFQLVGGVVGCILVEYFYRRLPPGGARKDDVLYQRACLVVNQDFFEKKTY